MTEIKYKSEVIGKGGISARVVAHSKSAYSGKEIVTFEYEAPKCILAELNTHRLFSRNAQSSRAVPIAKVIEGIRNNPVTPIYWGSNQAGMVAGEEIDSKVNVPNYQDYFTEDRDVAWVQTAEHVADLMQAWEDAGYHKQIVNRIGEAFTFVRGVITATEFDNFFHLRIHPAADPFIQELACCMWEAYELAETEILYEGEWHTPYVNHFRDANNSLYYVTDITNTEELEFGMFIEGKPNKFLSVEQALKISAAACAQVSFRKLDLSDETVDRVYSRLVDEETPHSSCCEHQATPMKPYQDCFGYKDGDPDSVYPRPFINKVDSPYTWQEGITHMDKEFNLWSGNFKGFIQNRKLIPNESCNNYKG